VRGKLSIWFIGIVAGMLVTVGGAMAYDLPSVNLGFTSFLDGGPPSGPGFYYSHYVQYYESDSLKNAQGNAALPDDANENLDVWVSMSQFIYQSDQPVFLGGKWGVNVMIPVVGLDMAYAMDAPFPEDNGSGLGDVLVGPFLQWDPIMGANGPKFMHRIELQVTFPTGKYDSGKELNPGSNTYTFNPYWAFTAFVTPKLTVSGRLHYLHNFKNDDPNDRLSGVTKTRAGDAFHANFTAGYEVITGRLRLGLNGYYLNQYEDTEYDGTGIDGTAEKVFAIGPGGVLHLGKDDNLLVNVYFESDAENRTEGNRYNVRYVHHF